MGNSETQISRLFYFILLKSDQVPLVVWRPDILGAHHVHLASGSSYTAGED